MTDTLTAPVLADTDDSDDHAHLARADEVNRGYIEGTPVTALCGRTFVPHRDPESLPLCQRCAEVMVQIKAGRGGAN